MVYVVLGSRRTFFGSFGRGGKCMGFEKRRQVRRGRALENFTCVCEVVLNSRRFSARSVCGKLKKIEDTHSNLSRREGEIRR